MRGGASAVHGRVFLDQRLDRGSRRPPTSATTGRAAAQSRRRDATAGSATGAACASPPLRPTLFTASAPSITRYPGLDDCARRLRPERNNALSPDGRMVSPEGIEPSTIKVQSSGVIGQNLSMRMGMRRFTRLTNGFSKKLENHAAALYFLHYNFAPIHQRLRITPAMAVGISDHVGSTEEIVDLLDPRAKLTA
jgi:hypothetical protein